MPAHEKMTSRELGLVLAQQLLDVEDLHYGLWDPDLDVSLANLTRAQNRYTEMLLEQVGRLVAGIDQPRILDVGCGTGHILQRLIERGCQVDAVNPSAYLNRQVHARLAAMQHTGTTLYESSFESFSPDGCRHRYDIVLFSESFQYIPLPDIFAKTPGLLKADGHMVICDFFKTAAHCDGGVGDRSFSGGHVLSYFYAGVAESPFGIRHDEDLTTRISPTIALLDEWLTHRLVPALGSIDQYLLTAFPRLTRTIKWLLRHKLARARYKYCAGNRSQAIFEKYKSYRLLILGLD